MSVIIAGGHMYPIKLKPATKNYMWGGDRLKSEYGVTSEDEIVAEAWMLSCNPAGASTIMNGPLAGKTLAEVLFGEADRVLGSNNSLSAFFPVLIKLLDAKRSLSVQVHPSNSYALENDGKFGKTEVWYVLDAMEGACLYFGLTRAISKEELRERLENKTIMEVLNRVPVKKGDVFFIEAGTLHAIGAGILLTEIQQNSDTTYRVYDYDRKDASGNKRQLHIEKALEVVNTSFVPGNLTKTPIEKKHDGYSTVCLADCEFFTAHKISVETSADFYCGSSSFVSLLFIEGTGKILFDDPSYGSMDAEKGDSIFLPAGTGRYTIQGVCSVIITYRK